MLCPVHCYSFARWRGSRQAESAARIFFSSRGICTLAKGDVVEQFVAHAVVEEGANGAGQVVLVLAGEFAAVKMNQIAPDVMGGEFVQRMDVLCVTPTDEKRQFGDVKLAGAIGQTARFAVQEKHIERSRKISESLGAWQLPSLRGRRRIHKIWRSARGTTTYSG